MRSIPSARLRGLMARGGSAETRSDGGILVTDPHRCNDDGLLAAEFPLRRTRIYSYIFRPRRRAPAPFDIVDHHLLEVGAERGPAQGGGLLAVDKHRSGRLLAGAGQRDPDIGMLGFPGAVHDAAHDRNGE